jgi:hypothetical protein
MMLPASGVCVVVWSFLDRSGGGRCEGGNVRFLHSAVAHSLINELWHNANYMALPVKATVLPAQQDWAICSTASTCM